MRWDLPTSLRRTLPLLAAALLAACQERLAAPADCPALCPAGYELIDTVLTPQPGSDSSFAGYATAGQGSGLRVSYQFPLSEDRAVYRFTTRPDSILVADTNRAYTIDSVVIEVSLVYLDTAVTNLKLYLYRMPATVDSSVTFSDLDNAFIPANIVDSFAVDTAARLRKVFSGAELARVAIPPSDSGILALGVAIRADQGTGVRIGSTASGSTAPVFATFVQVPFADSTVPRTLARTAQFATFRSETAETIDPDLLTVGGVPSSRALLRFPWPAYLRDSAQLVRVSLELVPSAAVPGIPRDTAIVVARPVLADFGAKTPPINDAFYAATAAVVTGQTDTVRLEIRRAAQTWQGTNPRPPAVVLALFPEVSTFTRPTFGSTRTPGFVPVLRVTYARPFPFEDP